jgi:hypothetical protein
MLASQPSLHSWPRWKFPASRWATALTVSALSVGSRRTTSRCSGPGAACSAPSLRRRRPVGGTTDNNIHRLELQHLSLGNDTHVVVQRGDTPAQPRFRRGSGLMVGWWTYVSA